MKKIKKKEIKIKLINHIKAPIKVDNNLKNKVFLAGSIEMGKADFWQDKIVKLCNKTNNPITFLNPRRDNWDSSWEQSIENKQFKEQVLWELDGLDMSDLIVIYFDPKTKSPISLLELGLHAKDKNICVCCPDGFWREGNVDIVCERYKIKVVESLEELADYILNNFN